MSQGDENRKLTGILECSDQLGDAYCIRKMIQLLMSGGMLIVAIMVLIKIMRRQRMRLNSWLALLIITISSCLIINIVFCFFNAHYWLFALETYFYNLYYLFLVGYVAKSYLLKYRQIKNFKKYLLDPQNFKMKNNERRLFFIIFISITVLYTAILIVSLILQIQEENHHSQDSRCEQIWYLCFQTACILLSITVLITLYKNQVEEVGKFLQYKQQLQTKQKAQLVIKQNDKVINKQIGSPQLKINNPLQSLWLWIVFNVASQLFNLVQSIFFVRASPPECLIIRDSYQGSNILQLIFVILTMYLSFASTLFYISKKAIMCQQKLIDNSYPVNQNQVNVHIQLSPVTITKSVSNSAD